MTAPTPAPTYLYKILTPDQYPPPPPPAPWTPLDARDGYAHLSTSTQAVGTANLFFGSHPKILILCIPVERLKGADLRWEAPAGSPAESEERKVDVFPHLYGMGLDGGEHVERVVEVERNAEGRFVFEVPY